MADTTTTTPAPSTLLLDAKGEPPTLALRPRKAAKALGICERTLWSRTQSGEIPCARLGRAVLYPVDALRSWLSQQSEGSSK